MRPTAVVLGMICLIAMVGCSDDPPPSPAPAAPSEAAGDGPVWLAPQAAQRGIDFACLTELNEKKWMPEIMVGGGAAIDFDDDGWMDLYLLQASGEGGNRLLRNRGDGTFEDVTEGSGAGDAGYGSGIATGDVDGDGDVDMFITNLGGDVLLRNDGGGKFTDITHGSGLGDEEWATSASFFDADGDGDLDLYACRYVQWSPETVLPCVGLGGGNTGTEGYCKPSRYPSTVDLFYKNDGTGRFELASEAAGIDAVTGYGLGVVAADYDGDGATDLFVANDTMPDRLWRNLGDGTFEEVGFNMACDRDNSGLAKAGMGVSVVDLNDDGLPDLIVCNIKGEADSLYINTGTHFRDVTSRAGISSATFQFTRFGLGLVDFDNDGALDYFAANGAVLADSKSPRQDKYAHVNLLMQGRGDRVGFKPIAGMGGLDALEPRTSRGAIFADFDNDGGMDIVVLNRNAPARFLGNVASDRGNWVLVDVRNAVGAPAIGARVEVKLGDRTRTGFVRTDSSYLTARDHRVHVGLGEHDTIDELTVTWPGGAALSRRDVPANSVLRFDPPTP